MKPQFNRLIASLGLGLLSLTLSVGTSHAVDADSEILDGFRLNQLSGRDTVLLLKTLHLFPMSYWSPKRLNHRTIKYISGQNFIRSSKHFKDGVDACSLRIVVPHTKFTKVRGKKMWKSKHLTYEPESIWALKIAEDDIKVVREHDTFKLRIPFVKNEKNPIAIEALECRFRAGTELADVDDVDYQVFKKIVGDIFEIHNFDPLKELSEMGGAITETEGPEGGGSIRADAYDYDDFKMIDPWA